MDSSFSKARSGRQTDQMIKVLLEQPSSASWGFFSLDPFTDWNTSLQTTIKTLCWVKHIPAFGGSNPLCCQSDHATHSKNCIHLTAVLLVSVPFIAACFCNRIPCPSDNFWMKAVAKNSTGNPGDFRRSFYGKVISALPCSPPPPVLSSQLPVITQLLRRD